MRAGIRTMTSRSPFAPRPDDKLSLASTVRLNNGASMPRFGLGLWAVRGQSEAVATLKSAINELGYVHVDTAQYYRNEDHLGHFVRSETTVPRSSLFLTTKTYTKGAGAYESIEGSLATAGLDYWDLVLIHAPDGGRKARLETWEALSRLVRDGKVKNIGVSNYGPKHLDELADAEIKPVVNQIECHPFYAQTPLRAKSESMGIVVQAYCPLARNNYDNDATLTAVAERNGKSVAQVLLRWSIQSGMVPLPKSSNPQRQRENAEALTGGWQLSDADMKALHALDRGLSGSVEEQTLSQDAP
ncbi:unnamed protein product [Parajaminaea phylloscopi]